MTVASSVTLFLVLCAMAALPSSSVALVVARSALSGVRNGLAAAAGIVCGDLIFMAMALLGMATLASQLGGLFVIIRYAAALYLIWFGLSLIGSQIGKRGAHDATAERKTGARPARGGLPASFAAGVLLTLGDIKAIFFYASLLPTFVDLGALSKMDILIVSLITIVSVGLVKSLYAVSAHRLAAWSQGFAYEKEVKTLTGAFFVSAGGYLAIKS